MLQFSHPGYWIAFLGLLIPVLIHLWNRREGRTVKIGSIELLQLAEAKRLRSLKFSDLWRLLLRLLLLGSFVLFLMGPHWQTTKEEEEGTKWALIAPDYRDRPDLLLLTDSLYKKGYELRWLSHGFPNFENDNKSKAAENYWSLLHDLSDRPSPPDSLLILAHPSRKHFQGRRPNLNIPLEWKSLPLSSPSYFLAQAWRDANELHLLIGEADREGSLFHRQKISFDEEEGEYKLQGFPLLNIQKNLKENSWEVGFLDQAEARLTVMDSFDIQIHIHYDSSFDLDKQYLEAALQAVSKYLEIPLQIQAQASDTKLVAQKDWLFWLSDKEVPDSFRTIFKSNLATFKPGMSANVSFFAKADGQYYLVKRLDKPTEETWTLPHQLIALLFEEVVKEASFSMDQQALAISQVLPNKDGLASINRESKNHLKALFFPIWLILLLLFVLERK